MAVVIDVDFIVPSFHSRELTLLCLKSFEKYKEGFNFRYIVVENSEDVSYKSDVLSISKNIKWIQNPTNMVNSEANAIAIKKALEHVKSEYVFICHNDVVACHPRWMEYLLSKINEGYHVVGTVLDNSRVNAVHISGILTYTNIAKKVDMFPVYKNGVQVADVGDMLTEHCRQNNLKYFCCPNTHNNLSLENSCKKPYNELLSVDRAFNDDKEIIFLHLGRGTPKTFGTYNKTKRTYLNGWVNFVERNIFNGQVFKVN